MLSWFHMFAGQTVAIRGALLWLSIAIISRLAKDEPSEFSLDIAYVDGIIYTTEISVGTPPLKLVAAIDTAWSDAWLPSVRCEAIACLDSHRFNPHLFDSTRSTTFGATDRRNVTVQHLFYSAEGNTARDTFTIGNVQVKRQEFAEAYDIESNRRLVYDTTLTLSRDIVHSTWSDLASKSMFQNMVDQKLLAGNNFALTLPRTAEEVGELLIGESPKAEGLAARWMMPLSLPDERPDELVSSGWQVDASGFTIGHGKTAPHFPLNGQAVFDSGSPFIMLPQSIVKDFLQSSHLIDDDLGTVACDMRQHLPHITISLMGEDGVANNFTLSGEEYASNELRLPFEGANDCHVMLAPVGNYDSSAADVIVLGSHFLRQFHTIFDHDKHFIGLVPRERLATID